ncbi:MAG: MBL fold metallo-hydrolase [Candidatus Latescibacterota bacterium]|nr:MAG: MBL fold metallo-hydrolase [Candidatus Latescibacterota bacterium]
MSGQAGGGQGGRTEVIGVVVGLFQENTFLVREPAGTHAVVIDPGDEPEKIVRTLTSNGWEPLAILNTHGHLDHIGAVQELKERYGIPFLLHEADEPLLRATPDHARFFGVPVPRVPEVDRYLNDGDLLRFGRLEFRVHHTPGHTPGGVSFHIDERLFAGDTLFFDSIGRTDLPGGDHDTLLRSIRERLLSFPDETVVHSGHGPDTTIGRERKSNPYLGTDASADSQ